MKTHVLGTGLCALGVRRHLETDTLMITISDIERREIGENLLGKNVELRNTTTLYVKNHQAIDSLRRALDKAEEILEKQGIQK